MSSAKPSLDKLGVYNGSEAGVEALQKLPRVINLPVGGYLDPELPKTFDSDLAYVFTEMDHIDTKCPGGKLKPAPIVLFKVNNMACLLKKK